MFGTSRSPSYREKDNDKNIKVYIYLLNNVQVLFNFYTDTASPL